MIFLIILGCLFVAFIIFDYVMSKRHPLFEDLVEEMEAQEQAKKLKW